MARVFVWLPFVWLTYVYDLCRSITTESSPDQRFLFYFTSGVIASVSVSSSSPPSSSRSPSSFFFSVSNCNDDGACYSITGTGRKKEEGGKEGRIEGRKRPRRAISFRSGVPVGIELPSFHPSLFFHPRPRSLNTPRPRRIQRRTGLKRAGGRVIFH